MSEDQPAATPDPTTDTRGPRPPRGEPSVAVPAEKSPGWRPPWAGREAPTPSPFDTSEAVSPAEAEDEESWDEESWDEEAWVEEAWDYGPAELAHPATQAHDPSEPEPVEGPSTTDVAASIEPTSDGPIQVAYEREREPEVAVPPSSVHDGLAVPENHDEEGRGEDGDETGDAGTEEDGAFAESEADESEADESEWDYRQESEGDYHYEGEAAEVAYTEAKYDEVEDEDGGDEDGGDEDGGDESAADLNEAEGDLERFWNRSPARPSRDADVGDADVDDADVDDADVDDSDVDDSDVDRGDETRRIAAATQVRRADDYDGFWDSPREADDEPGGSPIRRLISRLATRWSALKRAERVNVVLYALTGISMLAMTAELLAGPDSPPADLRTASPESASQTVPAEGTATTVTFTVPTTTIPQNVTQLTQAPANTTGNTTGTTAPTSSGGGGGSPGVTTTAPPPVTTTSPPTTQPVTSTTLGTTFPTPVPPDLPFEDGELSPTAPEP